jgi:hypothetical protein
MHIPEWFAEQLRRDFRGRYLIRWSEAKQCFQILTRIARGVAMRPARLHAKLQRLSEADRDEFEYRLRTGTEVFVSIYPGTAARCPRCEAKVPLTKHVWAFAHCTRCGKDFKAVSFELGHLLLEQLRWLDFERGGDERILAAMDTANNAKVKGDKREDRNVLEAAVKDDVNQIFGIQQVGYTGREAAWIGGPQGPQKATS